jgi:hypothetical protein
MRVLIDWLFGRRKTQNAEAAKTKDMAKPRKGFTLQLFRALGRE